MKKIDSILAVIICVYIYHAWFTLSGTLGSGDWPYLFKETIKGFSFIPIPSFLWLGPYYQITSKIFVEHLNIPWEITERIWWFWMFLGISFFSSYYFSKIVLKTSSFQSISFLLILTNSYILMIVGGGQMGVAMGYALAPLVFALFIKLFASYTKKRAVILSFILAIQVLFDPRIAYVTVVGFLMYFLVLVLRTKQYFVLFYQGVFLLILSFILTGAVNFFWIIQQLYHPSFTESAYTASSGLSFFSFGSFSQAIALLHPNWPENIFGKVYFLQPEFLFLPLIAFWSLLIASKKTIPKERKQFVIAFSIIAIAGSFLAKGVKDPLGNLYAWFFMHVPGFNLFRDPTKFYVLIVLAYAFLIPNTFDAITVLKKKSRYLIFFVFLLVYLFCIRQAVLGKLTGTFRPRPVPTDYIQTKDFLLSTPRNSTILWIPRKSSYSFFSTDHQLIAFPDLFPSSSPSAVFSKERLDSTRNTLRSKNIRYVIIPDDAEGTIFLDDRKYSEKVYLNTISLLRVVPWLSKIEVFGKVVIFQVRHD